MPENQQSSYTRLLAWQQAIDLCVKVYAATRDFPADEKFGLTSQLRRASVSIPSNIAEGSSRGGAKEFIQFLNVALGSIAEVETQIEIVVRVAYMEPAIADTIRADLVSVKKLVLALKRSLVR